MNIRETIRKYHCPGSANMTKRAKNAIYITPTNSYEHEKAKFDVCYELKKIGHDFITEATDNRSGLRRDIVDLNNGFIWEIETDPKRAERFNEDPEKDKIKVIKLWLDKEIKELM
jgi:hypothetical protein